MHDTLLPQRRTSRFLSRVALWLTASAFAHMVAGIVVGDDWSGAVSFRKPVTFGVSFALLLWACGWVLDRLPEPRRLTGAVAWALAVSAVVEVALISLQTWRGVASHFNLATPIDAAIFGGMGLTIVVNTAALVVLTLWVIIAGPADRAQRAAARAGLVMIVVGLGVGAWVIELGVQYFETFGTVPDTVTAGAAGVAKFPHALALHGIQTFILAGFAAARAGLGVSERVRVVRLAVTGYSLMLTWSIVHTNAGRAPFDLAGVETVLAVAGALALAWATATVGVAALRSRTAVRLRA